MILVYRWSGRHTHYKTLISVRLILQFFNSSILQSMFASQPQSRFGKLSTDAYSKDFRSSSNSSSKVPLFQRSTGGGDSPYINKFKSSAPTTFRQTIPNFNNPALFPLLSKTKPHLQPNPNDGVCEKEAVVKTSAEHMAQIIASELKNASLLAKTNRNRTPASKWIELSMWPRPQLSNAPGAAKSDKWVRINQLRTGTRIIKALNRLYKTRSIEYIKTYGKNTHGIAHFIEMTFSDDEDDDNNAYDVFDGEYNKCEPSLPVADALPVADDPTDNDDDPTPTSSSQTFITIDTNDNPYYDSEYDE